MTSIASSIAATVSAAGPRPDRLQAGDLSPEVSVQVALQGRPGRHPETLSDLQCHLLALHLEVEHDLIGAWMPGEQGRDLLDDLQAALRNVDVSRLLALDGSALGIVPGAGRLRDDGHLLGLLFGVQLLVDGRGASVVGSRTRRLHAAL